MKFATLRADALLLLAAIIWGVGFVAQKAGMEFIGPYAYTGIRFLVATIALLPLLLIKTRKAEAVRGGSSSKALLLGGVLAGLGIAAGGLLQQIGIESTTASNAGFITSIYVVLVPVLGLAVGYRILPRTWMGILLATVGLYLLSIYDLSKVSIGDLLVLLGTFAWAFQVLVIGWATRKSDPIRLAIIQTGVAAVVCMVAALIMEGIAMEPIWAARWYLLYSAVMATSVAFTFQIIGQRSAPPAHTAMLLSLEAVFAAVAGYLILDDRLTSIQLVGCGLMLVAVLVCQAHRGTRRSFLPDRSTSVS
ncbi:MAG: DMT family transporter [Phycisphaerales bacterium]|nr:DMT family transporter [Phycisphaerales bacterium]